MPFRCILHPIFECRISNQLADTLNRVPSPKFNFLDNWFAILILAVSSDFEDFALPLWALWKAIDFLEECTFVLGRWAGTGSNLGVDQAMGKPV